MRTNASGPKSPVIALGKRTACTLRNTVPTVRQASSVIRCSSTKVDSISPGTYS
ncbi:hypothetical protein OG876_05955 [Kribbella sp. NBC_00359]